MLPPVCGIVAARNLSFIEFIQLSLEVRQILKCLPNQWTERLNKAQENMEFVLCFKFSILRLVNAELTFDFLVGVRHCSGLCKG